MQRIFLYLLISVLLFSCDDGKIEVASFDFAGASIKSCNEGVVNNFFVYTIKDNRAIIIKIPENSFTNQVTTPIQSLTISGANTVTYRDYASNISDANICGFPTLVNTPLIKEWNGIGGQIEIETNIVKSENTTTGATLYDSYNHKIKLVNTSFVNTDGGQQRADQIILGAYNKPNLYRLFDFVPNDNVRKCTATGPFYKISSSQTLVLDVDNSIFSTTNLGIPKIRLINGSTNKFTFRAFFAPQTDASVCSTTAPPANTIAETWTARNGGTIEVTTATDPTNPGQFKHSIRLINVVLEKGTLNFSLGNDYKFGSFNN